jgi:hypothetical protein
MSRAGSTPVASLKWASALAVVGVAALLGAPPAAADEQLPISPVFQQNPVWCWAAVGEMALRYLGYPSINPVGDYQFGIVGPLGGSCWSNGGPRLQGHDRHRLMLPGGRPRAGEQGWILLSSRNESLLV